MTKILLSNIKDNPYRDRAAFPTREKTIAGLIESIEQTDFWDNLLCRFADNRTADGVTIDSPETLAAVVSAPDFDPTAHKYQIAYGHHRFDALERLEWTEIDIPVKFIDDETMLRIMSNENKDGWGSSLQAQLETVRQVLNNLYDSIQAFDDFDEYTQAGNSFFDYQAFKQAKERGIGYRKVHEFLGKEWSLSDVRIPMMVMSAIEKGYFTHEDLARVPSAGLLDIGCTTIVALMEGAKIQVEVEREGKKVKELKMYDAPVWPKYYVDKAIEKIIDFISVPEDQKDAQGKVKKTFVEAKKTVSAMKNVRKNMLVKGTFPGAGSTAFDINKAVRRDFFGELGGDHETEEERNKAVAQLKNVDMPAFLEHSGFKDFPGLNDIVQSVERAIARLAEGETEDDADSLKQDQLGDGSEYQGSDEYKEQVDSGAVTGMFEDTKNQETGETVAVPVGKVLAGLNAALSGVVVGCDKALDNVDSIDVEKEGDLTEVLNESLAKLATLYGKLTTPQAVTETISVVMKSLG